MQQPAAKPLPLSPVPVCETFSSTDLLFDALESSKQLMTIGGLFTFDFPAPCIEEIAAELDKWTSYFPVLTCKREGNEWLADLHYEQLRHEADLMDVENVLSEQMSSPFDQERPLCKAYYMDNLEQGRGALVFLDHRITDGQGFLNMITNVTSAQHKHEPQLWSRDIAPASSQRHTYAATIDSQKTSDEHLLNAANNKPVATSFVSPASSSVLKHVSRPVQIAKHTAKYARVLFSSRKIFVDRGNVQKETVFNNEVIDLVEAVAVGKAFDSGVSEVLLTCLGGAIRKFAEQKEPGICLIERNARCFMPKSQREPNVQQNIKDQTERLMEVAKRHHQTNNVEVGINSYFAKNAGRLPKVMLKPISNMIKKNLHVAMSYFVVPLKKTTCESNVDGGLGIGIVSYKNTLSVSLTSDNGEFQSSGLAFLRAFNEVLIFLQQLDLNTNYCDLLYLHSIERPHSQIRLSKTSTKKNHPLRHNGGQFKEVMMAQQETVDPAIAIADATARLLDARVYDDETTLQRHHRVFKVRRLYGLPEQEIIRTCLDAVCNSAQQIFSQSQALSLKYPSLKPKLDAVYTDVKRMHVLLLTVQQEDQTSMELGCGFYSVLLEIQSFLQDIHLVFEKFKQRKWRLALKQHVLKLPGLYEHVSFAVKIHQVVEQAGHLNPFPTMEQIQNDDFLKNWERLLKEFKPEVFFACLGNHMARNLVMFHNMLIRVTAASGQSYSSRTIFGKVATFGIFNTYYGLFFNRAAKKAAAVLNEATFDLHLLKFLWNLPDSPVLRPMIAIVYNHVSVDIQFSIPNAVNEPDDVFWMHDTSKANVIEAAVELQTTMSVPKLERSSPSYRSLIRVRLIASEHGPFSMKPMHKPQSHQIEDNEEEGTASYFCGCCSSGRQQRSHHTNVAKESVNGGLYGSFNVNYPVLADAAPALIFHVHGGGFVAMTSFSHSVYLRKWALDTGLPILSCDYRLAPEFPFPTQIEECYQAYRWAVKNALRIGANGQRIILVGDSAGANLVTAITLRCIVDGFRYPDGLILAYPVLQLSPLPSCSRLLATVDPMLSAGLLIHLQRVLCPTAVPEDQTAFLSPAEMPDAALQLMPPTRILVGQFDPLLDDSVFFYKRMRHLGKNVEISIRPGLAHGFLQLVDIVPEAQEASALASLWLRELAGLPDHV